jgi:hypothetical protein
MQVLSFRGELSEQDAARIEEDVSAAVCAVTITAIAYHEYRD